MKKETQICFLIDFSFILAIVITLLITLKFLPLFEPFAFALVPALIFIKLSEAVKRRIPIKSKWAAIISALFFYITVTSLLSLAITGIFKDFIKLTENLPEIIDEMVPPLINSISSFEEKAAKELGLEERFFDENLRSILLASLNEIVTNISERLLDTVSGFIKNLPLFFIGAIFTVLSSFYIAVDYYKIKSFFKRAIPEDFHIFFRCAGDFFKKVLGKIIKAYFILMCLTFFELWLGFNILGIKGSFKCALFTAVLDILPLLGTGCVILPWALFSFISEKTFLGWGLITLWVFITIIRNILEPHLIGRELGLSPLLSLIACFSGLKLMGLKGMILFPVVFLAVKYMFKEDNGPNIQ